MFQLIYASVTTVDVTQYQIRQIALDSRDANKAANITGALVVVDRGILQILEGDEPAVRALYKRISQDSRHMGCDILLERHSDAREFPNWAMGFCRARDDEGYEFNVAISSLKARRAECQRLEKIAS